MKSKPIFIAADLIPALLDGRKSCVRRLAKPQPGEKYKYPLGFVNDSTDEKIIGRFGFGVHAYGGLIQYATPSYLPGDILYVRETWHKYTKRVGKGENCHLAEFYGYKASIANSEDADEPWKSPACMPKEAARIWLKVTDVQVERLQEITEDGCVAEGIYPSRCRGCNATFGCDTCPDECYNEIDEFSEIWNSTVKKSDLNHYGWDTNPWVFVYEFERCEKPKEE